MKANFLNNLGQRSFYLGGFFLTTALPISALLFLFSIFLSFLDKSIFQLKDRYNLALFVVGSLMVAKNIFLNLPANFLNQNIKIIMWLDLVNWIPFFIFFIIFQKYLKTFNNRVIFSKFLIAGSIPFFVSCLLQAWFNLYGPYETLNGLIIWFQKPIDSNHTGITGLFSNQNYSGLWLTALLPFLLAALKTTKLKFLTILFISLDIYLIFLTTSKNAFLGLIIIFIILFKFKSRFFKIILGMIGFSLLISSYLGGIDFLNINFLPIRIYEKISSFNFFTSSRFEIFKITLDLISRRPLWGWGKSLFPDLYFSRGGIHNIDHTHSMPLELAFNYGLPVALILISIIFILILKAWLKTNSFYTLDKVDFFNKCWIVSSVVIAISHLNDITYYDGKISLMVWILLAGNRCIINENSSNENIERK